jgi:hypothetical protein
MPTLKVIKQVDVNGKIWTKEDIKNLILTRDDAVIRVLMHLHGFQTSYEQQAETTEEHNQVGFTGPDGEFLTGVGNFYLKRGFLTPKQIKAVRPRLVKYSTQILRIMANKQ